MTFIKIAAMIVLFSFSLFLSLYIYVPQVFFICPIVWLFIKFDVFENVFLVKLEKFIKRKKKMNENFVNITNF